MVATGNAQRCTFLQPCQTILERSTLIKALFEEQIQSVLVGLWSNERPLLGVIQLMDQLLSGKIAAYIKSGSILGNEGETTLIPSQTRKGPHFRLVNVLLLGLGHKHSPAGMPPIQPTPQTPSLHPTLIRNLNQCNFGPVGVSQQDFPHWDFHAINASLKTPLIVVN